MLQDTAVLIPAVLRYCSSPWVGFPWFLSSSNKSRSSCCNKQQNMYLDRLQSHARGCCFNAFAQTFQTDVRQVFVLHFDFGDFINLFGRDFPNKFFSRCGGSFLHPWHLFQQPSGGWCFGFKIVRSIFEGSEHDGRGHAGCQFLGVVVEFFTEFHHVHAEWSQRLADGRGGLSLIGQDTKSGDAFDGCRHCVVGCEVRQVVRQLFGQGMLGGRGIGGQPRPSHHPWPIDTR